MHRVAGGVQHRHGGVEVLALEVAVEGVGEQDDLALACGAALFPAGILEEMTSLRHCGKVRRALKPASRSENSFSFGYLSRALNSHGSIAA